MASLRSFFSTTKEYEHPVLRYVRGKPGTRFQVEFRRPREWLGYGPATLWLEGKSSAVQPQELAWNEDLNRALITEAKLRARTQDNEAERLGFMLRSLFGEAIARVGDGYFNAVLIQHLGTLAPDQDGQLGRLLASLRESRPYDSIHRSDCEERIDHALKTAADLLVHLEYSEDEAARILEAALVYYLDERFHVTDRRRLFPNHPTS